MRNHVTKIGLMGAVMAVAGFLGVGCPGESPDDLVLPAWLRTADTYRTQEETTETEPGQTQPQPQPQSQTVDDDFDPVINFNVGTGSVSDEMDSDGDGVPDCNDQCPNDPAKSLLGACGCGTPDTDSDSDGVPDCNDQCPGEPDVDSDGDDIADCDDVCPGFDDTIDSDGDGTPDGCEATTLCASPSTLYFGCTTTSLTFEVWNCGAGTLNYSIVDDADWLTLSSAGGDSAGEHDTITVTVNRTGLVDGDHPAEITVSSNIGPAIPILITLTVGCPESQTMQTASRTTGVAPLAVFFDAVEPASSVVQPTDGDYAALHYAWDFGDPGSGAWSAGRQNPDGSYPSKNEATGYVAAHVFEEPGTYTVTLHVIEPSGQEHDYTQQITVGPFTGTTYYVSSSSGSDSNNGLSPAAPFATFSKGMSVVAPNRRILFKRGDPWTTSSGTTVNVVGPGIIGAYYNSDGTDDPSRPKPQITFTSDCCGIRFYASTSDWRIMDLKLVGTRPSTEYNGISAGAASKKNLLLRLDIENFYYSIAYICNTQAHDQNFIVDCYLHNPTKRTMWAGSSRLAILGNLVDRTYSSAVRIWYNYKGVIGHNKIVNAANTDLKHHAQFASQYVIIADNDFHGGGDPQGAWDIEFAPQNSTSDERLRDAVIERNIFRANRKTQIGLYVAAQYVTIRNNAFIGTGATPWYTATRITQRGVEPPPIRCSFYNNTVYRGDTGTEFTVCAIGGSAQNTTVRNNLGCALLSTSKVMLSGTGSGLVQDHNRLVDNPNNSDFDPVTFELKAGSDLINVGTNLPHVRSDHYLGSRPLTAGGDVTDIGACEY